MGLGGPLLGLFCCKDSFKRRMPGRVVGRTIDREGRSGYVMTMRVREQDIRREKATSNICTNEALMGLAATVYMSAMGKNGMRRVAEASVRNAQYAIKALTKAGGHLKFSGKVFDEFVMEFPLDATVMQLKLLQRGILAGLPLGVYHPSLQNCLLVAVTEVRTKAEIDDYAAKVEEVLA
jgi:glycine dehydrogenase subunit 1